MPYGLLSNPLMHWRFRTDGPGLETRAVIQASPKARNSPDPAPVYRVAGDSDLNNMTRGSVAELKDPKMP